MAAAPAIDPRIQDLPSTTFFGKRLTRRQIADVQEMVQACSGLSRTELAKTVCEHLHWKVGSGASRVRLATRFLEQLAEHGIVSLPAKRPRPRGPDRPGFAAWQEWVERYHPLGYRKPLGCYVTYFLRDRRELPARLPAGEPRAGCPAGTSGSAGRTSPTTPICNWCCATQGFFCCPGCR